MEGHEKDNTCRDYLHALEVSFKKNMNQEKDNFLQHSECIIVLHSECLWLFKKGCFSMESKIFPNNNGDSEYHIIKTLCHKITDSVCFVHCPIILNQDILAKNVSFETCEFLSKCAKMLVKDDVDKHEALLLVKEGMKIAAHVYERALHNATQLLRKNVTDEEWCQMLVIVMGPASPRNGHVAMQYFENLVGKHDVVKEERKVNRRLYYAEGHELVTNAKLSVAQLEVERIKFSQFVPMTKDILADDAKSYLEKHCKK